MSRANHIHILFKNLFDYNQKANHIIIRTAAFHTSGLTGNCLRLANEIVNAHHVWNCQIEGNQPQFSDLHMHGLSDLEYIDKRNYFDSLLIIDQYDLDEQIQYAGPGGAFRDTVSDLLFNIINHSSYLRGQIAMEFRRTGIETPLTEYIIVNRGVSNYGFDQNEIGPESLVENNYSP